MRKFTIFICTHNRHKLLKRTLASLNIAQKPKDWTIDLLIVANACTDGTHAFLESYKQQSSSDKDLPMEWVVEPVPGKSHALNRGISLMNSDAIAFVDDDHRVSTQFLQAVCKAFEQHPEINLFCGRILPDWDGTEPAWVHDEGRYKIYPLPVPHIDLGDEEKEIPHGGLVPGGGNLALRREVFDTTDGFSAELGPKGHNLAGGEDSDFVLRARNAGHRLRYVPEMIQYHYVDPQRLKLTYLLRKSFQRSRAAVVTKRKQVVGPIPRYLYRKMFEYCLKALSSLTANQRRFYLVRFVSSIGELMGFLKLIRSQDNF